MAKYREIFHTSNPEYELDVRNSFNKQGIMHHLGATMATIEPGHCIIELPFSDRLTQQDGFFHAGVTSTIADSAGGYAAYSLMPAGTRVLTVEYKINLIAPAAGDHLSAEAWVIKPGKTLTITNIDVTVYSQQKSTQCAIVQQTLICINPSK